jgi:hypothetical protein
MLTVIRDHQGQLEAVCEWVRVDAHGAWMVHGRYIFLNQLEVNAGVNLHTVRKQLVSIIGTLVPDAIAVYWERRDKPRRLPHVFQRTQLHQLKEVVV